MREFTKSMMSYTWAMSLFGIQQTMNIFSMQGRAQQTHPATEAFNDVTKATEEEFGDTLKATFRAGDNVQRGMVDLMFSIFTLGAFNQNGASRMTSNLGQQSAEAFRQGMRAMEQTADEFGRTVQGVASSAGTAARQGTGWGPMPGMSDAPNPYARPSTDASANSQAGAEANASQQNPSGWGPMPSQSSSRS